MSQQPAAHPVVRHTRTRPQRAWTTREEAYLRVTYRPDAQNTVQQIADHLQRTYRATVRKAQSLGLHKRALACECPVTGEYYRVSRVADGLGVDESVVWRWIRFGKPDERLPMRAQWIAGADLATWLMRHPGVLNVARMTAEQRRWAIALMDDGNDDNSNRAAMRKGRRTG